MRDYSPERNLPSPINFKANLVLRRTLIPSVQEWVKQLRSSEGRSVRYMHVTAIVHLISVVDVNVIQDCR